MAQFDFLAHDEAATARCAYWLSHCLHSGQWVSLQGDLGAGKTAFARAAIRHLTQSDDIVPSPSFTLVQHYQSEAGDIIHADFYRLAEAQEVAELGVVEALETHIGFIEWAKRGADLLPPPDVRVTLAYVSDDESARHIRIEAAADVVAHLQSCAQRDRQLTDFLRTYGFARAERLPIAGDASARRYERLLGADKQAILMDWDSDLDDNGGTDYMRTAHLAQNIATAHRVMRFLAPHIGVAEIYATDEAAGFMLMEDLGAHTLADITPPKRAPIYLEAIESLLRLHKIAPPDFLPRYDGAVQAAEAALFTDWYLPHCGVSLDVAARRDWCALWRTLGDDAQMPAVVVLRDFHSVNLLWQSHRQQNNRLGIIDVQDAVVGTAAYDVVSLLQDARIDVSLAQEAASLAHYIAYAFGDDMTARDNFMRAYAIAGAQRNLKIAGIFVRLAMRDGKPHYLQYLPRILGYIKRNLAHPALAEVVAWLAHHAPDIWDT